MGSWMTKFVGAPVSFKCNLWRSFCVSVRRNSSRVGRRETWFHTLGTDSVQSGRQRSPPITLNNWHYYLQLWKINSLPTSFLYKLFFFPVLRLQLAGGGKLTAFAHATWHSAVIKMQLTWRNAQVKIACDNNNMRAHCKAEQNSWCTFNISWWMRFQLIAVIWVLIRQHPPWAGLSSDISSKFCSVRPFPRLSAWSMDGCRR